MAAPPPPAPTRCSLPKVELPEHVIGAAERLDRARRARAHPRSGR